MNETKTKFENETLDEVYEYRGIPVQIWNDDYGQQKFLRFMNDPLFGTQDIGLGSFNFNYYEDIKYIIDDKLDAIKCFPHGGKLSWFENGVNGYRDIKLEYRTRLVWLYLIDDPNTVDLTAIMADAQLRLDVLYAADQKMRNTTTVYIEDKAKAENK